MKTLIIFDLDGVITSELAYWDCVGLTLHELLYSPRYWNVDTRQLGTDGLYHPTRTAEASRALSRATLPEAQILALKARAINSNWDTCYGAVGLRLIHLLASVANPDALQPLQPWDSEWLARFRLVDRQAASQHVIDIEACLANPIFDGAMGLEVINRLDAYASELLGFRVENVFSRYSPFWKFCRAIFQEWYLGDALYQQTYGRVPKQTGKPGCIHFEQPLLPIERMRATLETLRQQEYTLGFATGRVYQEAIYPLKMYGLLSYFDEQHISTYSDVEQAEAVLRAKGDSTLLSKPHPFPFLRAVDARYTAGNPPPAKRPFIVVGDATSDILSGQAAGALTLAVLTGARSPYARRLLEESRPDFMLDDMTGVPALLNDLDSLATIQRLQFSDKAKAERLLRLWFARHMHINTESVTLTPKPVSLNSFNGFYRSDGEDYFFKTHVEEQGVLDEYYHAGLLQSAGYHIVRPQHLLREKERQMVIYPLVQWPVMFDLMRAVEIDQRADFTTGMLIDAEREECARLLDIYRHTLEWSSENAQAPIHQLFWHRLTGGRLASFYAGKSVPLPESSGLLSFEELLACRWTIQGVEQPHTLGELIERAKHVLHPEHAASSVIGHGDAHFGNVFLEEGQRYLYFDPAFAGRHSPLLDVIKPLYHNVFATWMYFPQEIGQNLHIALTVRDSIIFVEHDYHLTPIRQALLETKIEYLLHPLITMLRERDMLPDDWQEMTRMALMCCPLLTINLLDRQRYTPALTWLGLSHVMQMGNSGIEQWR